MTTTSQFSCKVYLFFWHHKHDAQKEGKRDSASSTITTITTSISSASLLVGIITIVFINALHLISKAQTETSISSYCHQCSTLAQRWTTTASSSASFRRHAENEKLLVVSWILPSQSQILFYYRMVGQGRQAHEFFGRSVKTAGSTVCVEMSWLHWQ